MTSNASLSSSPSTSTLSKKSSDLIVHKQLGKSSYTVYLVTCKNDNKQYAMKVFPYRNNKMDECYLKELNLSSLSHPNIISIVEAKGKMKTSQGDASYTLMEFAKYGDLAEKLYNKALPKDEIAIRTYFHQMVNAIDFLHSNKIAHMDVKPDNFLIAEDFSLRLADFDMAMNSESSERLTRGGTNNYRAPELVINRVDNPKACDMYALGITLFTMMFNSFPYVEEEADVVRLQNQLVNGKKEFWTEHPATRSIKGLDKSLMALIMGLCKGDPVARATVADIKKNPWYQGKTYNRKELMSVMSKHL